MTAPIAVPSSTRNWLVDRVLRYGIGEVADIIGVCPATLRKIMRGGKVRPGTVALMESQRVIRALKGAPHGER